MPWRRMDDWMTVRLRYLKLLFRIILIPPGYCQENKIYGTQVEWESINLVLSNVILGYNLQNDIRLEIEKKFKDKCVYA